jgi:ribosomal protein S18 acetylase RimI-like enzyme
MDPVTSARISVRPARSSDATAIVTIDHDSSRESGVREAVEDSRCLVAEWNGIIAGFAVGSRFYGFDFLELLVVSVGHRRRGVASALMRGWEAAAVTPKLFTSTNESNIPMQRLCERLGYARSGLIENLDEGDPEIIYFKPNRRAPGAGAH